MNRIDLLKKLLPGFIPLFVFIAADEIWGTKIGLFIAIGTGIVQMLWTGISEKRFDKFVLSDTLLLVVLGGVSILLDNDVFFKLKPGFIELILVIILGVSAFSRYNLPELMAKRYLKSFTLNELQGAQMRRSMKILFYVFLVHTALVFYSALFMSRDAWAFISGGLFYIIFAGYFIFEFIRQKKRGRKLMKEEWVPLVNDQGKVTGRAPRSMVHNGSKLLHPVVHMHVLNSKNEILLQKRPATKLIQPGRWDTAVGGHISAGEDIQQALYKEAFEEIGLKGFDAKLLNRYIWDSEAEMELVYLFITENSKNFNIHSDEVDETRFWSVKQIEENLGCGIFTPNFEHEYKFLKSTGYLNGTPIL